MSVNNLLLEGYYSTVVLVGLEPATSESLVRDLTTTPPSHTYYFQFVRFVVSCSGFGVVRTNASEMTYYVSSGM